MWKALSVAVLALTLATIWLGNGVSSVAANERTVPILETTQGPYRVEVRASPTTPRVGNLHMTIVLRTLEGREPVNDASVRVSALGPIETYTGFPTLNWHDFNIALPQEGKLGFIVDITENDRLTRVEFPLSVESGGANWGIIIVLLSAIPLLVAIAWYLRHSARRGLSRQEQ